MYNYNNMEHQNTIKRLAIIMGLHFDKERADDNNPRQIFHLPFSKIKGIPINAFIVQHTSPAPIKKIYCNFFIEAANVYGEEDENGRENIRLFHKNFVKDKEQTVLDFNIKVISEIFSILSTIVFDKFTAKFVLTIDNHHELFEEIFTLPGIEFDFGECCVCMEKTKTQTPCDHFLCLVCHSNIKETTCGEENCECKQQRCPICRKGI